MKIREAREGDELAIAEAHVASWKTTYAGLLPKEFLDSLSVENRKKMWAGTLERRLKEPAAIGG